MNWLKPLGYIVAGIIINVIFMKLQWVGSGDDVKVSFVEFTSIALTVATLVLGAVALILAMIAFYGFDSIRDESIKQSVKHAGEKADQKVDDSLDEKIEVGVEKKFEEMLQNGDFEKAYIKKEVFGSASKELEGDCDPNDGENR